MLTSDEVLNLNYYKKRAIPLDQRHCVFFIKTGSTPRKGGGLFSCYIGMAQFLLSFP